MATPFITDAQATQKIQEAFSEFTPGGGGIGGANYVFVQANGTPEENATELQEAYDTAKTMSPSATNRVTVIVSPGEYQFPARLVMDTEFVDLVSLTGNKDIIFDLQGITDPFVGDGEEEIVSGCFYVNADNVYVRGIKGKLYMSPGWDSYWSEGEEYNLPIHIASNLPNIVIEKCEGGFSSFNDGLYGDTILSGTFIDCIGTHSTFGRNYNSNSVASGTFIDCVGGNGSFGGNEASGTFTNCVGGDGSFGSDYSSTASGTFENCQGGGGSFGSGYSGTASGTFTNCVGDHNSFGGSAEGILSGKLYYCRLTAGTFRTVSSGGRTYFCVDGNGEANNQ